MSARFLEGLIFPTFSVFEGEAAKILASFDLSSAVDIKDMDTLYRVVVAVEEAASTKA